MEKLQKTMENHGNIEENQGKIEENHGKIAENHGKIEENHGTIEEARSKKQNKTVNKKNPKTILHPFPKMVVPSNHPKLDRDILLKPMVLFGKPPYGYEQL